MSIMFGTLIPENNKFINLIIFSSKDQILGRHASRLDILATALKILYLMLVHFPNFKAPMVQKRNVNCNYNTLSVFIAIQI